jgi:hypothetical protein
VANLVAARYIARGYKVPTRTLPTFLLRCFACCDPSLKLLLRCIDQRHYFDAVNATAALHGRWIPWQQSVTDMAESMIAWGKIPPSASDVARMLSRERRAEEAEAAQVEVMAEAEAEAETAPLIGGHQKED